MSIREELFEILGPTTILTKRFDKLVAYVENHATLSALAVAKERMDRADMEPDCVMWYLAPEVVKRMAPELYQQLMDMQD